MQKYLYRTALASLFMVLLVMLAGSVVRMSGAGMGCPDWPKCFGYYIPPTNLDVLTWYPDRDFKKGQMILYEDAFFVAKDDFQSGEAIDMDAWERYTKHDYAHFDPLHTWIEFINRFLGALSGVPVLAFFLLSLFYFRRSPLVTGLGTLGLVLLAFVAWLGKLVVDGNLIPHSITYHMFSALGLVAIFSVMVAKLKPVEFAFIAKRDRRIIAVGLAALFLLLVQIAMGTEVREEVDALSRSTSLPRALWIDALSFLFKVHRSFSLLVLAVIGACALWIIRTRTVSTWPRILLGLVVLEILAGVGMAYFALPAFLQPTHLMLAVLSFSVLILVLVRYYLRTSR